MVERVEVVQARQTLISNTRPLLPAPATSPPPKITPTSLPSHDHRITTVHNNCCVSSALLSAHLLQPSNIIQKARSASSSSHNRQFKAQEVRPLVLIERSNRKPPHLRVPPTVQSPSALLGPRKVTKNILDITEAATRVLRPGNRCFAASAKSAQEVVNCSIQRAE